MWGSFEWQTRQWQPSVGTPMEVPEPRTVSFSGAEDMIGKTFAGAAPGGCDARVNLYGRALALAAAAMVCLAMA